MSRQDPGAEPVLQWRNLAVEFRSAEGAVNAVRGIDLQVAPGEIVALVGESGSGKSVAGRATLGLLPRTAHVSGSILLGGEEVVGAPASRMRARRGRVASMIFQEPSAALDPVHRIGDQLIEAITVHDSLSRRAARSRAIEMLERVAIPDPESRMTTYPHQMSGGQMQRVMIAMAIAQRPRLLIADEPTTALDVTVQASVLDLIRDLREQMGLAVLLVTHNMGVVADAADTVAVMRRGEMVEVAESRRLFAAPEADYTRSLLRLTPRLDRLVERAARLPAPAPAEPAVAVEGVSLEYRSFGRPPVRALDGVGFEVTPGRVLGVVGESGSGKSTLTKAILGLERPTSGSVRVLGEDPYAIRRSQLSALRKEIGMVFQDPRGSLNPRLTVGEGIAEPMVIHRLGTAPERHSRVAEMLEAVELPASFARRYPHELSGGQRQRVGLARALILHPQLIIADEPTSALDVSVQAAVLDLFRDLQRRLGFAAVFITHDLAVVGEIADDLIVMRRGRIVERGVAVEVIRSPQDEYTRVLLAAAPIPDPDAQARQRELRLAAVS